MARLRKWRNMETQRDEIVRGLRETALLLRDIEATRVRLSRELTDLQHNLLRLSNYPDSPTYDPPENIHA